MERLPNELLVLVFRYLHKLDLLYALSHLNQRFQRLIVPYQYNVELTEEAGFSFAQFNRCVRDILPTCGTLIRSMTLSGLQQIRALRPYLRFLPHLQSLVVKSGEMTDQAFYTQHLQQFLTTALALPSLSALSLLDSASDEMLPTVSFWASKHLITLTLLSLHGFLDCRGALPMPQVRHLSIAMQSVARLGPVFKLMPNLETLKLSMIFFRNPEEIERLKVPSTLRKLHLEFGNYRKFGTRPDFDTVKRFLQPFEHQVHSLTILMINAAEEFSNYARFQSLVDGFVRLQTLEYYIRSDYRPDPRLFPHVQELAGCRYCFYTFPRPRLFDRISHRAILKCTVTSDLSLQELLDCTLLEVPRRVSSSTLPTWVIRFDHAIQFTRLRELHIEISISEIIEEEWRFVGKILHLSPNLTTLHLIDKGTTRTVQLLQDSVPVFFPYSRKINRLTYVRLDDWECHCSFFADLSQIFPNLRTLVFPFAPHVTGANFMPKLVNSIEQLRECFPRLIRWTADIRDVALFEELRKDQTEIQRLEVNISVDDAPEPPNSLSVWF